MAPVGGHYFLEYLLLWLRSVGIRDLILCIGYKGSQIQNWLSDGSKWGLRVRYSIEQKLLGTAGALKCAAQIVTSESCLVLNGDSFLGVDLREMYGFHRSHRALATMALARVWDSSRYGTVQVDQKGKILAFHEKDRRQRKLLKRQRGTRLINGGVYLVNNRCFEDIPVRKNVSLENEIFPALSDGKLFGFVTHGYFIDIGVPADFARAQTESPKRFFA